MRLKHFSILRCQHCRKAIKPVYTSIFDGSTTEPENTDIIFGVAKCTCSEYPIVQGILYLKKENRQAAVLHIRGGMFSKSIDDVLDLPRGISKIIKYIKPWGRIDRYLFTIGLSTSWLFTNTEIPLSLTSIIPKFNSWIKYLRKRLNNPTFYHSLAQISLFTRGYTLDVGSGLGHFVRELSHIQNASSIISLDNSYWNVYFSYWKSPNITHICCDVQYGLPFHSKSITNLTFNDCLHCIPERKTLLRDVTRILTPHGIAAFCHVHNTSEQSNFVGAPIPIRKLIQQLHTKYHYAISERTLHQKIILKSSSIDIKTLRLHTKSDISKLELTPSYIFFAFITPPGKRILKLHTQFRYFNVNVIDYGEDAWLINN